MKLIRIVNGTYGYRPAKARAIEPMQAGDPPFEVDDREAQRLVALGVAIMVHDERNEPGEEVATDPGAADCKKPGDNPPEDGSGAGGADDARERPAYSTSMKADELRALMEECGLKAKFGMSKADMVAELNEHFDNGADDAESPPSLAPEDPVT